MRPRFAHLIAGTVLAAAVGAAWGADDALAALRFDITRFDVSGNTLLPQAEVDAALAPFLGKGRDFGYVQRALEALEALYHERGYNVIQVNLPEQELNGGVVRLLVIQSKIAKVKVSGNTHFDEANIRRSLPALREGETPNLKSMSSALRLANESPSKKVNVKLQSADENDDVNAIVEVSDESPWKGILNLDNTGTSSTGKTHASVVLQHSNLFGLDHIASIQYTTTVEKPSKVSVYGLGYHIPLYDQNASIDLFAGYSNVDSGAITTGSLNVAVSGKGGVYGARYNQMLAKRGSLESRLVYGIDYRAFKNDVLFAGQNFGNDVTVRPLSVGYVANTVLAGGQGDMSLSLLRNIPGGKNGGSEDFTRARAGAASNYTMMRGAAAFARALQSDWQVRAILNGQYSSDALIPGEQFGAGGASSVRGFAERELSGDSGLSANLEGYTPNLCASQGTWQCRVVAFVDSAYATRNHSLAGEFRSTSIGSVGLGLRFAIGNRASMQLDYGHVIHSGVLNVTDKNRVHVRIGLTY